VIPGLYNVSNRIGEPSVGEGNYEAAQVGVFGQLKMAYNEFLFVELTGRNDWVSTLAKENRSFFYPSANVSFVASQAIESLRESSVVNLFKLRGGVSQVGQV